MRARLRDLGITIGHLPTGKFNAITDVPGVQVGHATVIHDHPRVARTGVTIISPRDVPAWQDACFAAYESYNGNGEMTGLPWLDETGLLMSPIGLTNTHQVGIVRDTLVEHEIASGYDGGFLLPVVAETYDGWLNDIDAFHVKKEHVEQALANLHTGSVAEGNVGGGTGMICHEFKGGIGTSSRLVTLHENTYTVGILVQANYGKRYALRVNGVPVGQEIPHEHTPVPNPDASIVIARNSIIVIIATDAPLLPIQCRRLVKRATLGLARVGGGESHSSGDIFLAFSTGNHWDARLSTQSGLQALSHDQMNPLFTACAEATEEAILNALTAAETMIGFHERVVHALPLDVMQLAMHRYARRD
jgi:D-aminopeptidase